MATLIINFSKFWISNLEAAILSLYSTNDPFRWTKEAKAHGGRRVRLKGSVDRCGFFMRRTYNTLLVRSLVHGSGGGQYPEIITETKQAYYLLAHTFIASGFINGSQINFCIGIQFISLLL